MSVKWVEVVERTLKNTYPFPYCPVNGECSWKKTQIEKIYIYFTKLKATHSTQQKHTARIIFNLGILMRSRTLLRSLNALNICQIYINIHGHIKNIYASTHQHLCINLIKKQTPQIFNNVFEKPSHKNPTQFSETNIKHKNFSLTSTKYSIFLRGSKISNEILKPR